jgi:hypothetical protein
LLPYARSHSYGLVASRNSLKVFTSRHLGGCYGQEASRVKAKSQERIGADSPGSDTRLSEPDHKVIDMERFFTALMQALHDAYALGWKDRSEIKEEK